MANSCSTGRYDFEYAQDSLTGARTLVRIHEMTDPAGAPLNPPNSFDQGTASFATAFAAATACAGSRDFEILCDPTDRRPIKVVTTYHPVSGSEIEYFEIDGITAYTGNAALLIPCEEHQDYEVVRDIVCDNGVSKIHELVKIFDENIENDLGTLVSDLWYAVDGVTASTAPLDLTLVTLGACPVNETVCRSFC